MNRSQISSKTSSEELLFEIQVPKLKQKIEVNDATQLMFYHLFTKLPKTYQSEACNGVSIVCYESGQ